MGRDREEALEEFRKRVKEVNGSMFLRFSVDAMIATYQFRPSDVLPTLVLAEQLENSD